MFCRYFSFFGLCLFLPTQRSSLGHGSSLHGRGITSLPGFENLTMGYNKYLRPYFGGEPVQIAMSLDITSISSISESDMDYTATISLRQRWTDPRLVFHGNKSFTLDARLVELLWVPDTYIVESKRSFLHDVTVGNRLVRLFSNGTVLYALRITTTVACNMDLSKYPMDTQTCRLQLESWGYDENDVTFAWLRGNDSVHGIEKLRLSQYTVEHYHTLVSKSQQETAPLQMLRAHLLQVCSRSQASFPISCCMLNPEGGENNKGHTWMLLDTFMPATPWWQSTNDEMKAVSAHWTAPRKGPVWRSQDCPSQHFWEAPATWHQSSPFATYFNKIKYCSQDSCAYVGTRSASLAGAKLRNLHLPKTHVDTNKNRIKSQTIFCLKEQYLKNHQQQNFKLHQPHTLPILIQSRAM
ncbi:gamma-aminobutyric acid receptor subunit pi-like isoform X3 [Anomalospiza imberbis]|uniref:gamma-aminobutyric acid receptor subunit pi-like isoform X3 n=1 Tax=Anomalospiza imberbis TaxID=187417 RepID=UPI00358EE14C